MTTSVSAPKKGWQALWRRKGLVFLVLLVAAVAIFWTVRNANRQQALESAYQTAKIERGTLIANVGATGNVRANQTAILTWQTSGQVAQVNVKLGDKVKAGDILATLSPTSLPQNIILAQADLVAAERALQNLMLSKITQAQAQLALVNAKQNYDRAKSNLDALLNTNRGATSEDLLNAQAQLTLAKNNLKQAEAVYAMFENKPDDDPQKAQAYTALYNARQAVERAERNLNYFLGVPTGTDIEKARANLALAQAQLEDAQREWERLKNGPDPNDILAAQARVDAARAAVRMSQLIAPFDGTVTIANPLPGDQVSPGTVGFRIDDLSRYLVDVQVSEVNINSVAIGQPVTLTFDAILGKQYEGRVIQIARAGTITQGVVNFLVTIELTNPDANVKPGMTAAVTILVTEKPNVLLVPNRAVRLIEGKRYVFVLRNGQPERVEIVLGATSDLYSEVASGDLQEGDTIILNPPLELTQPNGEPPFFRR
ncbi:MAG: efflux RND transporter periplasmic adaptor subunit [Anaerolineales bacterium]|nr:efflux RND transporter periplasmic adaptor subunit [Anaerolineales bacterium]